MRNLYKIAALVLIISIYSCVQEDHFEYSKSGNILEFEISNQSGTTIIDAVNDSIIATVANGTDMSNITVNNIAYSSFAKSDIKIGDTLDFTEKVKTISVISENGDSTEWTIMVIELGAEPQIDNSDFSVWHTFQSYEELGVDDVSSSWATSNPGAVFGGMDPNVQKMDQGDGNFACKLTTRYSLIGSWVNKPIAAGSVFTGDFENGNINFDDPTASVKFGVPFTATPKSFSVKYKYTPGPQVIDAVGNELSIPDQGDMYVLLERREGDVITRVATAWYRIEAANATMETKVVDFIYGELPAGTPAYMMPEEGQTYALEGAKPTHITVVFTSSAEGDLFQGAKDSELIIDDFLLVY